MPDLSTWLDTVGAYLTDKALPALLLLALGIVAIRLTMRLVDKALEKTKLEPILVRLVRTAGRIVLYILLALMAAEKMGIDVTGVVALASVLTLAISLSIQNALTNLFSGLTLLYTKPFTPGDYVEIAGQGGTVLEIGLAYTKLATPDNKTISIPNGSVTSAENVNYTVAGTRRMEFFVSASYDAPVQLVLDTLREAADLPAVLEAPGIFVALDSYGDSAIRYVVRAWSSNETYWDTYYAINRRIKAHFDEKGIEMTYPHLNIHVSK